MAEEQIKIRIQADAADFKVIMDAVNAKLAEFGKTATVVAGNVKIVQKDLDNTANSFAKVGNAAQASGEKIKTANQGYTHLALVLQDLPYGFRGIQNNLPALIGDLASATGPIYLLSSAVIAFFTAYDMGAFGAKKSTDAWAESVKKAKDELHDAINYTNTSTQALKGLVTIGNDYTLSEQVRLKAFKEIKDELGKVNKAEADKIKNMSDATNAVATYTEAVKAQQLIEITGKRLAELEIQQLKDRAILAAQSGKGIHPLEWFGLSESDASAASKRITKTIGEVRLLEEVQSSALKSNLNNPYSEFNKPDKSSDALVKKNVADKLKAIEEISKAEQEGYLATLSNQQKEEYLVNEKFVKLEALAIRYNKSTAGLEQARLDELAKIKEDYDKKEKDRNEKSIKSNSEWESKIAADSSKANLQIREEEAKEKKKIIDREFKNEIDAIQNKLDAELKGHKKEPLKQQEDYKQAIAGYVLMAMQLGLTAEEVDKLQDKINKLNSTAEGAAAAFTPLGDILNNLATNVLVELGTQIGGLLTGAEFSLSGFFGLIADALIKIGTHLVLISHLFLTVDALFASGGALAPFAIPIGIAAIAAGIALKSSLGSSKNDTKKFANGGVISGPTYGLMGEYPGAKSNPEIVAPLDKLKSMIGNGGNGEFVLRGSDLVLALNRSNSSLNLRRGS